jgi:Fe-S cluster assembly ATP-binding protein
MAKKNVSDSDGSRVVSMLKITDLHVAVDGGSKPVLKGLTLEVKPGEVHAIMGPNGSGKSTLSYVLAGRDGYAVTGGSVRFEEADLLELEPEERAAAGIFLAMQYPVEIPGVANNYFLRQSLNALRRARGEPEVSAAEFIKKLKAVAERVGVDPELLKRDVNAGFSGGEKKRNEILQMVMLEPKLCVLDETDSGLDIDALKTVADGVNSLRSPDRGMIVITHYQRLLDYIVPDFVHILADGRIRKTGGKELALALEEQGYEHLLGEAA